MKLRLKILLSWLVLILLTRLALLLPHRQISDSGLLIFYVQLLLLIVAVLIAKQSQRSQRWVFVNFSFYFGYAVLLVAASFVGESLFPDTRHSTVYYYLYVNGVGNNFVLLLALLYAITDYLAPERSILKKYTVSLSASAAVCALIFFSFITNPLRLYNEPDYVAVKKLSASHETSAERLHREPTEQELATELASSGQQSDPMSQSKALETVERLRPYLQPGGEATVFWRPLFRFSMEANSIAVLLLAAFFFILYRQGRPCGAYMDKILLLFLVSASMEVLHNYGFIHSVSIDNAGALFAAGRYVSVVCMVAVVYVFDRKLHFALSITGQYYEEQLVRQPVKVTRWQDNIDRLILNSFFTNTRLRKQLAHLTESTEEPKGNTL